MDTNGGRGDARRRVHGRYAGELQLCDDDSIVAFPTARSLEEEDEARAVHGGDGGDLKPGRRYLVTGCAGFIASHLTQALTARGCSVVGVDAFRDNYSRSIKERNLEQCLAGGGVSFIELDLADEPIEVLLEGVDGVFHLAARPGVRTSWGPTFDGYLRDNLSATQRVFEAAVEAGIRVVYASSSSVYGDAETYPLREDAKPCPVALRRIQAGLRGARGRVRIVGRPGCGGLRFFSVYGPRQRPDMAFAAIFDCLTRALPFRMFGSGRQSRDFTFVGDVVDATLAAMQRAPSGRVYNVGGGSEISLLDAMALCERIVGRRLELDQVGAGTGDARRTLADFGLAEAELGWTPATSLEAGLRAQAESTVPAGCGAGPGGGRGRLRHYARDSRHPVVPAACGWRRAAARAPRAAPARSRGSDRGHHAGGQGIAAHGADRRLGGASHAAHRGVAARLDRLRRRRARAPPAAAFRLDLVHAHGALSPATIALGGRLLGLPCLVTVLGTGDMATSRAWRASRWAASESRLLFRWAWFAALSEERRTELLARGVPPERILALPNGVDLDVYRPATARRSAERCGSGSGSRGRGFVGTFVGRLHPGEGRGHAARCGRRACPAHARGGRRRAGARPARGRGCTTRHRGQGGVPGRVVGGGRACCAPSDAFLLSSHGEGMSNALLEAMACGLPCLASRSVGGAAELLARARGMLLADGDVPAWAAAIQRLIDEPGCGTATGTAAAGFVAAELVAEAAADRLAQAYAIIAGRPAPASTA